MLALGSMSAILLVNFCAVAPPAAVFLGDKPGDVEIITCPAAPPVTLLDGRILVASGTVNDGGQTRAAVRFSSDNGTTWSEPRSILDPPGDRGVFQGIPLLVSRSGAIHFFSYDYGGFDFKDRTKSKSYLAHCRSMDGGVSRSPVQRVPMGRFTYTGSVNSAIQLTSGRILAPISVLSDRAVGAFVAVVPYSDDDGLTWNPPVQEIALNTGAADWYESGAAEPVVLELKDGRVWLLVRSQDGFQWESFSSDGGLHWTPPRHTRFVSNQSAMAVLRLRDGRIMLFWNNCGAEGLGDVGWGNAERAILAAALSSDEGKTWVGYREVARIAAKDQQAGYPYATQIADGKVLLLGGSGPMARIDPGFLTRTSFEEDFAQGIGRWSVLAAEGAEVIDDPDGRTGKVMCLRKPNPDRSAAACLNFPFGSSGEISTTVRIEWGFQGVHVAVSDNYDLPGLPRDGCFPFRIKPKDGDKAVLQIIGSRGTWQDTPGTLQAGAWHELNLTWDCGEHRATLAVDKQEIAVIEQFVFAPGLAYLRLRSLAEKTDAAGLLVRSVKVSVSL